MALANLRYINVRNNNNNNNNLTVTGLEIIDGDGTRGSGGWKSPSGIQGLSPGGGLGVPEAEDIF